MLEIIQTIQDTNSPHAKWKAKGYQIVGPSSVKPTYCRFKSTMNAIKGEVRDNTKAHMGTAFHHVCAKAMSQKLINNKMSLADCLHEVSNIFDDFEANGVFSPHSNSFEAFAWNEEKFSIDCTSGRVTGRDRVMLSAREAWTERLLEAVKIWHTEVYDQFDPIAVEHTMHVERDANTLLLGTADLIAKRAGTDDVVIVDWKTTGRRDTNGAYFKSRVLPQLTLYSYLYQQEAGLDYYPSIQIVQFSWTITKSYPKVVLDVTDPIYPSEDSAMLAVKRLNQYIKLRKFQQEPDWVPMPCSTLECDFCSYHTLCANFTNFKDMIDVYGGKPKNLVE